MNSKLVNNMRLDKPVVIWIGNDNNLSFAGVNTYLGYSICKELNNLGFQTMMLGYWDSLYLPQIEIYDSLGLRRIHSKVMLVVVNNRFFPKLLNVVRLHESVLKKLLIKMQPDVIITTNPFIHLSSLARKLEIKLVLWGIDDPLGFDENWFNFASQCEYIFTISRGSISSYREHGLNRVEHLALGFDPEFFKKMSLIPTLDISFIGHLYHDRHARFEHLISPLIRKLKIKVHLYGRGWNKYNRASVHGPVDWRKVSLIYNMSRIVLNIHRRIDALTDGSLNARVFEVLGSGRFLLTDYVKGIEHYFEPQRDLITYQTASELVELAEHYLDDIEKRENIAKNGYEKAVKLHSLGHRSRRIADVLRKIV